MHSKLSPAKSCCRRRRGSMKKFGFGDKAVDHLNEVGIEVEPFENVEPEPEEV